VITSIGSGVGYGILRSLRLSGRDYYVVGLNSLAFSAGVFDCDVAYVVPPVAQESQFVEALMDIVVYEQPMVIYAGRDADLPVLASLKPQLEALGTFVMTGSCKAVEICNDKYQTYKVLSTREMPFVQTALNAKEVNDLVNTCGFPLLAKPRLGHASLGVKVLFNEYDLAEIIQDNGSIIVQEYLVPKAWGKSKSELSRSEVTDNGWLRQEEEYSVQVVLGYGGITLGVFASRNTLWNGAPMAIEVVDEPNLETQAVEIALVLAEYGLLGPCNLQAKRVSTGDYVFFEINPRFTGITPTRAVMGFNEVEAVYRYFVEGDIPSCFLDFDKRQCAYRYFTESVFSADDLEQLRRTRRWQAYS